MHWRSTTLRFAALVFVLQCAAAGALLLCVHVVVRGQVYADATATTELLQQDLVDVYGGGRDALRRAVALRSGGSAMPDAVLLLAGADGRPIAGNLPAWPQDIGSTARHVRVDVRRSGHSAPEPALLIARRLPDGTRLLTGTVVDDEARTIRLLELATPLALSLAIIFAALAAWLAARMIVLRLDRAVSTLEAVRTGDLSRRAPVTGGGDAFAMLATAINAMLDRIERLVEQMTLATDMLAHDLKSPLTRLHSALERAAIRVETPVAAEAVDRAMAEGVRLLQTVETALRITRAEAGIGRNAFTTVDLARELREIAEIYGPLAEDAEREIDVAGVPSLILPLHRELIGQALGNLVDNALKYGAGTITLALDVEADRALVSVTDQGPGIPPEHRATALRRFGRIDEARSGSGAGLGLSLVAAVARLHGGDVVLQDAGGLRVTMALPLGTG